MKMMSSGKKMILILLVSMAAVVTISHAQQSVICGMSIEELMGCRPSATQPNPVPPSRTCCNGLSHADPNCLCSFRNSTLLISFNIDPELALQLPRKCGFANAHCN